MRVDRSRDRPVRHLEWRVRLLGVGAVLALAGMMMESDWMVNLAIGVLVVTFALRFVSRGDPHAAAPSADSGDVHEGPRP